MKTRKPLNRYSLHRIEKLNAEVPERIKLIARCGGLPRFYTQFIKRNDGSQHEIKRVVCIGGVCELCKMHANGEILEPHEAITKRSAGGKVSLENSLMVHRSCHKDQHSKPQLKWLK